jgi:site-specific recombinase XerD
MKNTNTFGVHFFLRRNRESKGQCPVIARISVNGTRVELYLKAFIAPDDWNPAKGLAKSKNTETKQLNSYLEQIRGKLSESYRELTLGNDLFTAETLKNHYLTGGSEQEEINQTEKIRLQQTILWLVKEHNEIMKTILSPGSLKNYFTTERYVKKFLQEKLKIHDLPLTEITLSFLTQFETFIRTTPLKSTDPCNNNGTMKHIERMKKMVNWAYINEWLPKNPFIAYKLRFRSTQREMLSQEELEVIEVHDFEIRMLQTVRDLFVFSCYTGLSYVDLMGLQNANIVSGGDGFTWIKTKRTKTDVPVDVPLLDPALEILGKYKDNKGVNKKGVFPKISNQEINRSLKIIAEICKIKKPMTFHLARHTFATTVTLINGVPIESISKMLGHTKLTTTMVYAKVVKQKLSMDMALLKTKMDKHKSKNHLRIV